MDVNECRLIGRALEDAVASTMQALGFRVFRNLIVPYRLGDTRSAEVDIVALKANQVFTLECKNVVGQLAGEYGDKRWTRIVGDITQYVSNPLRQSKSHKDALETILGVPVFDLVVVRNGTQVPSKFSNLIHFDDLVSKLRTFPSIAPIAPSQFDIIEHNLIELSKPDEDVIQNHLLAINRFKNGDTGKMLQCGMGVEAYCLMVGEVFYAFTDTNGKHWGVEDVNEAALFESEEQAIEMSWVVPNSEVCTLSLGTIEALSDLSDEFEGLTPAEYAEAIGARPW